MADRIEIWQADVLRERWDDATRTYTSWDQAGGLTTQRPYTAAENTDADARATAATSLANETDLTTKARAALTNNAAYLASTPTQAQVAAQVKDLTRQVSGLIRLFIRALDTLDGT